MAEEGQWGTQLINGLLINQSWEDEKHSEEKDYERRRGR